MAHFQSGLPDGLAVQQLEQLLRKALFKPANQIAGYLLQEAAERIDAAYQPKSGEHYKGRQELRVRCFFGVVSK
jgi:hypothetical protein